MKKCLSRLFVTISFCLIFTSCYRMPTDDDYSVVPITNNPAVTCEKKSNVMPGMGY